MASDYALTMRRRKSGSRQSGQLWRERYSSGQGAKRTRERGATAGDICRPVGRDVRSGFFTSTGQEIMNKTRILTTAAAGLLAAGGMFAAATFAEQEVTPAAPSTTTVWVDGAGQKTFADK